MNMCDFLRKRVWLLCLAGTALIGLSGCDDDDAEYDDGTLPDIEQAPNDLSGLVMGKDGSVLAGATVKLGDLVTETDGEGKYTFTDVLPGEYVLRVESEGRLPVSETLVVKDMEEAQNLMWNPVLAKDLTEKVLASSEEQHVPLEVEGISDIPDSPVSLAAVVPADVTSTANAEISFVPFSGAYSAVSRSNVSTVCCGVEVVCNVANVKFNEPILLEITLDDEAVEDFMARKVVNGQCKPADFLRQGNKLTIKADEVGIYEVYAEREERTWNEQEPIEFTRSVWDNREGKKRINVKNAKYTYKEGTEITTTGETWKDFLFILSIKSQYGGGRVSTAKGTYKLNIKLKVGYKLEVMGVQNVKVTEIKRGDLTVTIKEYGTVELDYVITGRDHTGGSN